MTFFGEYLKRLRERAGFSQEQFAEVSDVSSAYISQLETGRRNPPTPDILRKMAPPLNVPYIVLLMQADHLHESDQYALLLRAIRVMFTQDPGREQLDRLLRESINRWVAMDDGQRQAALDAANAEHVSELILEALLEQQANLILSQLLPEEIDGAITFP